MSDQQQQQQQQQPLPTPHDSEMIPSGPDSKVEKESSASSVVIKRPASSRSISKVPIEELVNAPVCDSPSLPFSTYVDEMGTRIAARYLNACAELQIKSITLPPPENTVEYNTALETLVYTYTPKFLDDFLNQLMKHAEANRDRHGASVFMTEWCMRIICNGASSHSFLHHIKTNHSDSGVCAKQWRQGDVAFRCRTCQTDPTCAICLECFRNGDHEGHDFAMVVASGGCCDCGDSEAWAESGFCSVHRKKPIDPLVEMANITSPATAIVARMCVQQLVSFTCNIVASLGPSPTTKRRFLSACNMLLWLRKLLRYGPSFVQLCSHALLRPFVPAQYAIDIAQESAMPVPSGIIEDDEREDVHVSGTDTALTASNQNRTPVTHIQFLLSFITEPGPARHGSMFDRPMVDLIPLLLTRPEFKRAIAIEFLRTYVLWRKSQCRLAQHLAVHVMTVPALAPSIIGEHAPDRILSLMQRVISHMALQCDYMNLVSPEQTGIEDLQSRMPNLRQLFRDSLNFEFGHWTQRNQSATPASMDAADKDFIHPHSAYILSPRDPSRVSKYMVNILDAHMCARSYYPIFTDLVYGLRHIMVARHVMFSSTAWDRFVRCVTIMQHMNPCIRRTQWHVEYTDESWIAGFDVETDFAGLFRMLLIGLLFQPGSELPGPDSCSPDGWRPRPAGQIRNFKNTQAGSSIGATTSASADQATNDCASPPLQLDDFEAANVAHNSMQSTEAEEDSDSSDAGHRGRNSAVVTDLVTSPQLDSFGQLIESVPTSASTHTPGSGVQTAPDLTEISCRPVSTIVSYLRKDFEWLLGDYTDDLHTLDFRTEKLAVSMHIPLHRYFSRMVAALVWRLGTGPSNLFRHVPGIGPDFWPQFVEAIMRVQVVTAQVRAGMWVRNGDTAVSQAFSYRVPSFCEIALYPDLFGMQLTCCQVGADAFTRHALARFGLLFWVKSVVASARSSAQQTRIRRRITSPLSVPNVVSLAEDMLRLLLSVASNPTVLSSVTSRMRTEITQTMSIQHSLSHSRLTSYVPFQHCPELDQALEAVADFHRTQGSQLGSYRLKDSSWQAFDALYFRFAQSDLSSAQARFTAFCSHAKKPNVWPIPDMAEIVNRFPMFAHLRPLLSCGLMLEVFEALFVCALDPSMALTTPATHTSVNDTTSSTMDTHDTTDNDVTMTSSSSDGTGSGGHTGGSARRSPIPPPTSMDKARFHAVVAMSIHMLVSANPKSSAPLRRVIFEPCGSVEAQRAATQAHMSDSKQQASAQTPSGRLIELVHRIVCDEEFASLHETLKHWAYYDSSHIETAMSQSIPTDAGIVGLDAPGNGAVYDGATNGTTNGDSNATSSAGKAARAKKTDATVSLQEHRARARARAKLRQQQIMKQFAAKQSAFVEASNPKPSVIQRSSSATATPETVGISNMADGLDSASIHHPTGQNAAPTLIVPDGGAHRSGADPAAAAVASDTVVQSEHDEIMHSNGHHAQHGSADRKADSQTSSRECVLCHESGGVLSLIAHANSNSLCALFSRMDNDATYSILSAPHARRGGKLRIRSRKTAISRTASSAAAPVVHRRQASHGMHGHVPQPVHMPHMQRILRNPNAPSGIQVHLQGGWSQVPPQHDHAVSSTPSAPGTTSLSQNVDISGMPTLEPAPLSSNMHSHVAISSRHSRTQSALPAAPSEVVTDPPQNAGAGAGAGAGADAGADAGAGIETTGATDTTVSDANNDTPDVSEQPTLEVASVRRLRPRRVNGNAAPPTHPALRLDRTTRRRERDRETRRSREASRVGAFQNTTRRGNRDLAHITQGVMLRIPTGAATPQQALDQAAALLRPVIENATRAHRQRRSATSTTASAANTAHANSIALAFSRIMQAAIDDVTATAGARQAPEPEPMADDSKASALPQTPDSKDTESAINTVTPETKAVPTEIPPAPQRVRNVAPPVVVAADLAPAPAPAPAPVPIPAAGAAAGAAAGDVPWVNFLAEFAAHPLQQTFSPFLLREPLHGDVNFQLRDISAPSLGVHSCGHVVHRECLDGYLRAHEQRLTAANTFRCPLCRRYSNSVIPLLPCYASIVVPDKLDQDTSQQSGSIVQGTSSSLSSWLSSAFTRKSMYIHTPLDSVLSSSYMARFIHTVGIEHIGSCVKVAEQALSLAGSLLIAGSMRDKLTWELPMLAEQLRDYIKHNSTDSSQDKRTYAVFAHQYHSMVMDTRVQPAHIILSCIGSLVEYFEASRRQASIDESLGGLHPQSSVTLSDSDDDSTAETQTDECPNAASSSVSLQKIGTGHTSKHRSRASSRPPMPAFELCDVGGGSAEYPLTVAQLCTEQDIPSETERSTLSTLLYLSRVLVHMDWILVSARNASRTRGARASDFSSSFVELCGLWTLLLGSNPQCGFVEANAAWEAKLAEFSVSATEQNDRPHPWTPYTWQADIDLLSSEFMPVLQRNSFGVLMQTAPMWLPHMSSTELKRMSVFGASLDDSGSGTAVHSHSHNNATDRSTLTAAVQAQRRGNHFTDLEAGRARPITVPDIKMDGDGGVSETTAADADAVVAADNDLAMVDQILSSNSVAPELPSASPVPHFASRSPSPPATIGSPNFAPLAAPDRESTDISAIPSERQDAKILEDASLPPLSSCLTDTQLQQRSWSMFRNVLEVVYFMDITKAIVYLAAVDRGHDMMNDSRVKELLRTWTSGKVESANMHTDSNETDELHIELAPTAFSRVSKVSIRDVSSLESLFVFIYACTTGWVNLEHTYEEHLAATAPPHGSGERSRKRKRTNKRPSEVRTNGSDTNHGGNAESSDATSNSVVVVVDSGDAGGQNVKKVRLVSDGTDQDSGAPQVAPPRMSDPALITRDGIRISIPPGQTVVVGRGTHNYIPRSDTCISRKSFELSYDEKMMQIVISPIGINPIRIVPNVTIGRRGVEIVSLESGSKFHLHHCDRVYCPTMMGTSYKFTVEIPQRAAYLEQSNQVRDTAGEMMLRPMYRRSAQSRCECTGIVARLSSSATSGDVSSDVPNWKCLTELVDNRLESVVQHMCSPLLRRVSYLLSSTLSGGAARGSPNDWASTANFLRVSQLFSEKPVNALRDVHRLLYSWARDYFRRAHEYNVDGDSGCQRRSTSTKITQFPFKFRLTPLPRTFQDLYYEHHDTPCVSCGHASSAHAAMCMVCGKFVCVRDSTNCHLDHVRSCSGRHGILLALKRCDVMLVLNTKTCFWGSVYLDEHGEEDIMLTRGKPMFLNEARCQQLTDLFLSPAFTHFIEERQIRRRFALRM
jgi:Proteolysis_6 C-terminal/Putative zinc finger in N-recognin (UBR box)/E3 ubiquitin-protein ligase UBR1-like, winged-helix domain